MSLSKSLQALNMLNYMVMRIKVADEIKFVNLLILK